MKIKSCNSCDLCLSNNFTPVSGRGNKYPTFMFVGEAPGYTEYKEGSPFVGVSGKLLQSYINNINLNNVSYITNAVKCRPPANREPLWYELDICRNYLEAEIIIHNPKVIILLGRTAINSYFNTYIPTLKKLVGIPFEYNNRIIYINWHPSYILRNPKLTIEYDKMFKFLSSYYKLINPLYK